MVCPCFAVFFDQFPLFPNVLWPQHERIRYDCCGALRTSNCVVFFSGLCTLMKLRHNETKRFSILATLSVVVLFILSSVATVVFKLVTCAAITIDDTTNDVVFIDGSVQCHDGNRSWLLAVAVLLCLFPILYAAALRHKEKCLSDSVQRALCGAFKKQGSYWGVVTSIFRLVMSIVFATIRDFPSTAALIQLFLCVAVLILLTYQKPYDDKYTYNFDILCHAILIFQFGFAVLVSVSESLGVSTSESNLYFATLRNSAAAIAYLRYVSRCLLLSSLHYFVLLSSHVLRSAATSCLSLASPYGLF